MYFPTTCPDGQYINTNSRQCEPCQSGYYALIDHTLCVVASSCDSGNIGDINSQKNLSFVFFLFFLLKDCCNK